MKKILCLLLCVLLLLICGCDKKVNQNFNTVLNTPLISSDADNDLLQQYLNKVAGYKSPVRQYGTPASYIDMNDTLVVCIIYPETNINELNTDIIEWVSSLINQYKSEINAKENMSEAAELTVTYESYINENKSVIINFNGVYYAEYLSEPINISKTFTVSIANESLENTKEPTDAQEYPTAQKQIIDPNKPMIALTFDDGPSAHTERLLDIFARYGGNGTFFILGNLIEDRKNTLIRIVNEGHDIGNHTWNHRQLTRLTSQEITDQIMMTRAKIFEVTGVDCTIVRPPYGACNDNVQDVGITTGVSFINWSVDTLDWKNKNAQAIYNEIISTAKNGDIILCHDLHKTTVDAMEIVIPKLIADGYQLVTVSELMKYSNTPLEAGKIYYMQ